MKENTGYIMVDATGVDLASSSAQTVTGIYAKLQAAIKTKKAVLLCGLVNGTAPVSPTFVQVTPGASDTITMTGFAAVVASDDSVTPACDNT